MSVRQGENGRRYVAAEVEVPGSPEEITDPELLRIRERSPMIRAAFEGLDGENPDILLKLEQPAPGLAHMFIMPMDEQTSISVRIFLYGKTGAQAASHMKQEWSKWLGMRFGDLDVRTVESRAEPKAPLI